MRRWFAGCIVVFVLVLALFGGSGAALAYFQPAAPGDALYSIQNRVTQVWIRAHPERSRARLALQHLARHAVWLEKAAGTPREEAALRAYDQALRFTAQHLMKVPEKEWPTYRAQWVRLNQQALNALSHFIFVPRQQPTLWQQAKAKMEAVLESAQSQSRQGARGILDAVQAPLPAPTQGEAGQPETAPQPQTTATPWTTPMPVAFPTEFVQTHQQFFPLTGAHATLACTSCHAGGRFAGTNDTCQACHAQDRPPNHFQGQCSLCHSTTAWSPANFNHQAASATDCQACHAQDRPPNHFQGQCSSCHATTAWRPARFDHQAAGATDCQACHAQDRPPNHFQGQCSSCHTTTAWRPANFDHQAAGATDCQACHAQDRPPNHFQGQCSSCHATTAWRPANFNHQAASATDCQACHAQDRPPNHFQGQCSSCHTTTAWRPANFDHQAAGATDCQACHAQDRPPNHFQGQCSSCHATTAWRPARFDHTFPLNHGGANGACSVCHPNGADTYTCEACHSMNQLLREHQEEGIFDFAGRCTQCHLTGKADEHENDREDLDERGKGREEGLEKDHENDREDEDEHEDEDDHSFRGNQNIAFASDGRGDFVSSGLLTTNLLLVGGLWASALTSLRRR